jgi:hypothetical protein
MSSAEQRYTVIVTQFVTAGELRDQNHSSPLFIEDGVEAPEPGNTTPGNLRPATTSLIGREYEVDAIKTAVGLTGW